MRLIILRASATTKQLHDYFDRDELTSGDRVQITTHRAGTTILQAKRNWKVSKERCAPAAFSKVGRKFLAAPWLHVSMYSYVANTVPSSGMSALYTILTFIFKSDCCHHEEVQNDCRIS